MREVLRLLGVQSGLRLAGTAFGVDAMTAERKRYAVATLDGLDHDLSDPRGLLVLAAHQGYAYHVVDGADLGEDDPPVWDVVEVRVRARHGAASVTGSPAPRRTSPISAACWSMEEEMGKQPPKWAEFVWRTSRAE